MEDQVTKIAGFWPKYEPLTISQIHLTHDPQAAAASTCILSCWDSPLNEDSCHSIFGDNVDEIRLHRNAVLSTMPPLRLPAELSRPLTDARAAALGRRRQAWQRNYTEDQINAVMLALAEAELAHDNEVEADEEVDEIANIVEEEIEDEAFTEIDQFDDDDGIEDYNLEFEE